MARALGAARPNSQPDVATQVASGHIPILIACIVQAPLQLRAHGGEECETRKLADPGQEGCAGPRKNLGQQNPVEINGLALVVS